MFSFLLNKNCYEADYKHHTASQVLLSCKIIFSIRKIDSLIIKKDVEQNQQKQT